MTAAEERRLSALKCSIKTFAQTSKGAGFMDEQPSNILTANIIARATKFATFLIGKEREDLIEEALKSDNPAVVSAVDNLLMALRLARE